MYSQTKLAINLRFALPAGTLPLNVLHSDAAL